MKIQPYNNFNTPCNISMNGYFVTDLFSQIYIHFCQLMTLLGMSTQQCISLGKIRNLLTNFCIVFLWNDNLIPVLQKTIPSLTGQMTLLLLKKRKNTKFDHSMIVQIWRGKIKPQTIFLNVQFSVPNSGLPGLVHVFP